jgi:hypothetical protein
VIEQSRYLAIRINGDLELNLHDQNQSTLAHQIVVRSGRAGEGKLPVGAESNLSASDEMIFLACGEVGTLNSLPVSV